MGSGHHRTGQRAEVLLRQDQGTGPPEAKTSATQARTGLTGHGQATDRRTVPGSVARRGRQAERPPAHVCQLRADGPTAHQADAGASPASSTRAPGRASLSKAEERDAQPEKRLQALAAHGAVPPRDPSPGAEPGIEVG